jgi:hypothetical protein
VHKFAWSRIFGVSTCLVNVEDHTFQVFLLDKLCTKFSCGIETVIKPVLVDLLRVLESDLHLAMKDAVIRCLVGDDIYWTERYIWLNTLRVDVEYVKNRQRFLVECETRPSIKRLIDKGKRRNRIPYRNLYLLVVPVERYYDVGGASGVTSTWYWLTMPTGRVHG